MHLPVHGRDHVTLLPKRCTWTFAMEVVHPRWRKLRLRLFLITVVHLITMCLYGFTVLMAILLTAFYPQCLLGFDSVDTFVLPDFRNLSKSESSELFNGEYPLPQEYFLGMIVNDYSCRYQLCVLKNPSDLSSNSACMRIGHVNRSIPCNQSMRAECLPGAIIDSYFGISVWNMDQATVQYLFMEIPGNNNGEVSSQNLTNTTNHLSDVWYRELGCQGVIAWDISALVTLVLAIIIHSVACGFCCSIIKSMRQISSEYTKLIPPKPIESRKNDPPQSLWSDREQALLQDIEENVVPKIASDWEQFAIYLGVEPTCIDIIRRNNAQNAVAACREMVRNWMTKERDTGSQPRTWDTVVQAIKRMGREDLVDELSKK